MHTNQQDTGGIIATMHPLAAQQRQAARVLHTIPGAAIYENTVMLLKSHYTVLQLAVAYHSQLQARTQLSGGSLQELQ